MPQEFCCDDMIGGRYYMTVNGKRYEGLGELTLMPGSVERAADVTGNGEIVVTQKAKLVKARLEFANKCDADPQDLYEEFCAVNIVFVERDRGVRHLFTKAHITGSPELNISTGHLTGLEVNVAFKNYHRTTQGPFLP